MKTVDEIKSAALQLPPADKLDLYRRLDESAEVRSWRLEELRREIQKGVDSIKQGRFTEHDDTSLDGLAHDIKKRGREMLRAKTQ